MWHLRNLNNDNENSKNKRKNERKWVVPAITPVLPIPSAPHPLLGEAPQSLAYP